MSCTSVRFHQLLASPTQHLRATEEEWANYAFQNNRLYFFPKRYDIILAYVFKTDGPAGTLDRFTDTLMNSLEDYAMLR